MRGYVTTPAGQLHYRWHGDGPPVVLLHQSPRSSAMFGELLNLLASTYRCFAVDMPGFGSSDRLPEGATIGDMAEWVVEAMAVLDLEPPHLFGIHFGNKVAMEIAAEHPARIRDVILCGQPHSLLETREQHARAVFGLNGHAPGHPGAANAERDPMRWALLAQRINELLRDVAARTQGEPSPSAADHYLACLIDMAQSWRDVDLAYEAVFLFELARQFARIRVPVGVIELVTPWEEAEFGSQEPWLRRQQPQLVYKRLDYSDDNSPPIAVAGWSNWDAGELAAAIREMTGVFGEARSNS